MESTKLSDLTDNILRLDRDANGPYSVKFANNSILILKVGFDAAKSTYRKFMGHPNVMAAIPAVHEYKHYRRSGSKFWTSRAGMDLYIAIPATAVNVLHFVGLSYPKIEVNGHELTLNVSGGTDGPGWGDWVSEIASTSVNLKAATLKALIDVAIPAEEVDGDYDLEVSDYFDAVKWKTLVARGQVKIAKGVSVSLAKGYSVNGQTGGFIAESPSRSGKDWVCLYNGIDKVRIKTSQIDYLATAEANGIPIPEPESFMNTIPVAR